MWPVLVVSLAVQFVAPASTASRAAAEERALVALVNEHRASGRLPALKPAADLSARARDHAGRMAAAGAIFHSARPLYRHAPRWNAVGENVGMASSARDLFTYFLQSPGHRALILDASFTHVGAGVQIRDGTVFGVLWFGSR